MKSEEAILFYCLIKRKYEINKMHKFWCKNEKSHKDEWCCTISIIRLSSLKFVIMVDNFNK